MSYKKIHQPILLKEFLNFFGEREIEVFIDGTLGGGGHAEAILEAHPEIKTLFGCDEDPLALAMAESRLERFGKRVVYVNENFESMGDFAPRGEVEGIFLDLGLSSMQLDEGGQGFSFGRDAPLDMRRDPRGELTAYEVINKFSESKLGEIFREGEERRWRQAAKAVCEARRKKKICTTFELCAVLQDVLPRYPKKIHPMTLVFQSLRIYVNRELQSLEKVIAEAIELLAPGGRLGIITFHSLEDRIVKNHFRALAQCKSVKLLTKKPIIPTLEEIKANPRSRSAKMRFIEKT